MCIGSCNAELLAVAMQLCAPSLVSPSCPTDGSRTQCARRAPHISCSGSPGQGQSPPALPTGTTLIRQSAPNEGLRVTPGRGPATAAAAGPPALLAPEDSASSTTWNRPLRLAAAFSGSDASAAACAVKFSAEVLDDRSDSPPVEASLLQTSPCHLCQPQPG